MTPTPLPLALYRAATRLVGKPMARRARARLAAHGIPRARQAERDGYATLPRPRGHLVWCHGASVGETLSLLPLLPRLGARVLVTSGTATSAQVLAGRLPEGVLHQFAPVDHPGAVRRFLDHWRPDLAVFAESEIWPGILTRAADRGVPLALVNARLSARSLARWARVPRTAGALFGLFSLVSVQDAQTRAGLAPFAARGALRLEGNLKAAIPPPAADPAALAGWQARLGGRPVWVASSTHPGEDAPVLDAHAAVLARHAGALLILVPRHPERGPAIADLARARFRTARLAAGDAVAPGTQVLVADTMGQTGLWYRLAPIVFLAGSFGGAGGHNPWEPVALGCALLHGPRTANAAADYARLDAAGAATCVADGTALAAAVTRLLDDPQALDAARAGARAARHGGDALAEAIAADLRHLLARAPRAA